MTVSFHKNKFAIIRTVIMLMLAILLWIQGRYPLYLLPLFVFLYFLISCTSVTMKESVPGWWSALLNSKVGSKIRFLQKMTVTTPNLLGWAGTVVLFLAGPRFSVWCMQWTILEKELFEKTGKGAMRLNMLCIMVLYLAMLVILARPRWACISAHLIVLLIAFADYFVYEFRGNEITFADLDTLGTGLSVAKNYQFRIHDRGAIVLMLTILAIAVVRKFSFHFRHPILVRIAALALVIWMVPGVWGKIKGRVTQTWEKKGTYKNGFIVNFICGIRDGQIDPPSGYTMDEISILEEEYGIGYYVRVEGDEEIGQDADADEDEGAEGADKTAGQTTGQRADQKKAGSAASGASSGDGTETASLTGESGEQRRPTIITIMNESFADYRLIGDLQTNIPVTPFIDSLDENTTHGFVMTSVYGAKTPNSEWEYLTGHTMAFMPGGSVVYQQFIDKQPFSMVTSLKNLGYKAIAMHPYYSTGWRRNTVYPKLGFDDMMFLDTGDFDETNILRDYVTDQELFDKIIDQFEAKEEGQPLFIMSVTMQNHGGYKDEYENFTSDVWQVGGELYTDASQYLSLIHQTDKAVENLITYFSQVDEPVEIIMFGDHYPSLQAGFVQSLNHKGTSGLTLSELEDLFTVPFFIWTNYDSDEEQVDRTSLNYLGTIVLEKAGIELPPYNAFLKDLMEVIPAMNIRGYYSKTQGKYLHNTDATGIERTWMQHYRWLQYNAMFDQENRSDFFFPRPVTQ